MIISELTVKRPYATLMVFVGILLLGIIAAVKLPVAMLPDIELPAVTVIVPYPGASASDVENDITRTLEDALSTVPNLDKLQSVSRDNVSMVTCEFDWGVDVDAATSDIRNNLDLAKAEIKQNAPDSEEPIIFKIATDAIPVIVISVSAGESWRDLDYIVEKRVTNPLQRASGVGNISTYGGLKRQIRIILNWEKIKAYNIPPALVIQRLAEENVDVPLGRIKEGRRNYFLRMPGRFNKAEEIAGIALTVVNGRPVFLGDIAEVRDDFAEETTKSYQNGEESIVLVVQKQSGENTIEVSREIRKTLEKIKPNLPGDVKIEIPFDSADYVIMTMDNLKSSVFTAAFLVVLITFLFLRRWKSSLVVLLTIPFSLMAAFIYLFARGLTLNIISMMSLAITIGMVVDNTIVIVENISRHLEEGRKPFEASIMAAKEVGGAITGSSLTTIVVFIPLVFATGITGILFKQLGTIVAVTIFASLFVALTLTPMLASRLFKAHFHESGEQIAESRFYKTGEALLKKMEIRYRGFLVFCLRHKKPVLSFLVAVFVFSVYLARFVPSEFFPSSDSGEVEIKFSLNESARLEETDRVLRDIGDIVDKKEPERLFWYGTAGETSGGFAIMMGGSSSPNEGNMRLKFVPRSERDRHIADIARNLREEMGKIPGLEKFSVKSSGGMGEGMQQAQQIEVELTGQDLDVLLEFSRKVEGMMKMVEGAVDVGISFKEPRMEIHVDVDREKAKRLGVNTAAVGQTLRTYFYGSEATRYRDGDEDFEVFVQLSEKERYDAGRVGMIPVPTGHGGTILLKDIARINLGLGPVQIDRKDRQRIIIVGCDTYRRSISEIQADIEKGMKNLEAPAGVGVEMGGEIREQREAFSEMTFLLLLGTLFVYMVMAAQFESLKTPFIIAFSIPFTFIGVIWAVLATGVTFSIMSFMAMIMLIGVVVNNAIVLVSYTNQLRAGGMKVYDSIVNACTRRLRPVMMTSLTTIFGMLPLALGLGSGGEMWKPFGVTAIGGLLLSGMITLFLVPMVYSILHRDKGDETQVPTEDR